jgi:cellulose biosynthesis protein BcsQ
MRTIAFFNNKGGVGKTTLTYHLAHMLSRLGYATVAVDVDPQANLTSAFLGDDELEALWDDSTGTLMGCVAPILEGTGDIREPRLIEIAPRLSLLAGDLGLSRFEDRLSDAWPRGFRDDPAALRTTSAFHRIIQVASRESGADVVLMDVGPNLGAINRAALLAAEYLVIPLAADLFSLQGLKNLGPTVRTWRIEWRRMLDAVSTTLELPSGDMEPAGYVVLQHAVRLDRPVRAFGKWLARIPGVYATAVRGEAAIPETLIGTDDEHCLATLRNYRSLMPMAQDARKPMFDLRPADGAIGSHAQLAQTCRQEFERLAETIARRCGLEASGERQARLL